MNKNFQLDLKNFNNLKINYIVSAVSSSSNNAFLQNSNEPNMMDMTNPSSYAQSPTNFNESNLPKLEFDPKVAEKYFDESLKSGKKEKIKDAIKIYDRLTEEERNSLSFDLKEKIEKFRDVIEKTEITQNKPLKNNSTTYTEQDQENIQDIDIKNIDFNRIYNSKYANEILSCELSGIENEYMISKEKLVVLEEFLKLPDSNLSIEQQNIKSKAKEIYDSLTLKQKSALSDELKQKFGIETVYYFDKESANENKSFSKSDIYDSKFVHDITTARLSGIENEYMISKEKENILYNFLCLSDSYFASDREKIINNAINVYNSLTKEQISTLSEELKDKLEETKTSRKLTDITTRLDKFYPNHNLFELDLEIFEKKKFIKLENNFNEWPKDLKNSLIQNEVQFKVNKIIAEPSKATTDDWAFYEFIKLLGGNTGYNIMSFNEIEKEGYVAQGVTNVSTEYGSYLYVSAHRGDNNNLRIYIYTTEGLYLGRFNLDGITGHAGGITYDEENNIIFLNTDGNSGNITAFDNNEFISIVESNSLQSLSTNPQRRTIIPGKVSYTLENSTLEQLKYAATVYYYDGYIYTGTFEKNKNGIVSRYKVNYEYDEAGNVKSINYIECESFDHSKFIQGMLVTEYNNKTYLITSHSSGFLQGSYLEVYDITNGFSKDKIKFEGYFVCNEEGIEGLDIKDGQIIIANEFAHSESYSINHILNNLSDTNKDSNILESALSVLFGNDLAGEIAGGLVSVLEFLLFENKSAADVIVKDDVLPYLKKIESFFEVVSKSKAICVASPIIAIGSRFLYNNLNITNEFIESKK